ncbi:MAG: DUF721 domain-containing protein [Deltaproteobacteria bacterium]|nr:DUF721 domain-containing protein [Deltaproteobacteria bacterium]
MPLVRKSHPTSVGELLAGLFQQRPEYAAKARQYRIWELWPRVVGESIARNATPIRMQDTTLLVGVRDSVWLQELTMLRPQLLAKIHTLVDPALVTEIRVILTRE